MSDQQKLNKIKTQVYFTNCFMLENELFDHEGTCRFDSIIQDGLFCFFKTSNYDFKHLNFYLNDGYLVENSKINWKESNFITELVTTQSDQNQKVKNWLRHQEIYHYRTFFRMLRTDKTKFHYDYSKVQHPEVADFETIILYLEKTFDKHTERIPNNAKLRLLQESCYIIKEKGKIAAVLITEIKGKNQELYFMVTLPEYEGKGYGSILMTHILNLPDIQRWIIWVDDSNKRAIEWYYKIGYKKDKLVNNIYINKNIMTDKIKQILVDTREEFDFTNPSIDFMEAGYLDSFDIITIVVDLETTFDVKISGALIVPENFKSIDAIANLIQMSKDASQV
jgi:acyl carrier protein/GNAT superfamily N-acetyltransferase